MVGARTRTNGGPHVTDLLWGHDGRGQAHTEQSRADLAISPLGGIEEGVGMPSVRLSSLFEANRAC